MNDLAIIALRNIWKRKRRTFLTMLGIFIGIASVVALVSLGQGLESTIEAQFEKIGADKIIIQAKEIGYGGQNAPGQLKEKEVDLAKKAAGVTEAAGMLFLSGQAVFNDIQRTIFITSIPKDKKETELIIAFNTWETEQGRLLFHTDSEKAVIGNSVAHNNLFEKNVHIGNKLLMNGNLYQVVGILKRTGDPTVDSGVILPEDDARKVLGEEQAYSFIVAKSSADQNPETVANRIEKIIRRDRHQKEGKEDFIVQTSTELIESFLSVLRIVQVVFIGIAAISLLVGGVGIMNTMFTAVLERTKEIGVMKAIGAKNKDVLTIFLVESGFLGLAGGIIGIIIGMSISKTAELIVNTAVGPNTITAVYPPFLIFGVLLFSIVLGMISGFLPARRASMQKPVDALRHE